MPEKRRWTILREKRWDGKPTTVAVSGPCTESVNVMPTSDHNALLEALGQLDRYEVEVERGCGWDNRDTCSFTMEKMDDWETESDPAGGYVRVSDLQALLQEHGGEDG